MDTTRFFLTHSTQRIEFGWFVDFVLSMLRDCTLTTWRVGTRSLLRLISGFLVLMRLSHTLRHLLLRHGDKKYGEQLLVVGTIFFSNIFPFSFALLWRRLGDVLSGFSKRFRFTALFCKDTYFSQLCTTP